MWRRDLLSTSRGRFEVFQSGEGPPLCATHLYSAFNETGDHFADAFSPHRSVYLVNLRGAGASPSAAAADDLSMASAAADLEAVRTALGVASWDFAGHSTGGMLGLLYALRFGGSLRSLTVVGAAASRHYTDDPSCIYHPGHPSFQRMQDLIEKLKSDKITDEERRALSEERTSLSLHRPERYPEYFPPGVSKRISAPRLDYYSRTDFPRFDLRSALRNCAVPTLVACGRHDVQCPLSCSEEIAASIPGAALAIFEESCHYPFLEERALFAKAVRPFLGTAA